MVARHLRLCGWYGDWYDLPPENWSTSDESPLVATTTPTFPGFPPGVTSGTYDNTLDTSLASAFNPAFVTDHGGTAAGAETALFYQALFGEGGHVALPLSLALSAMPSSRRRRPYRCPASSGASRSAGAPEEGAPHLALTRRP